MKQDETEEMIEDDMTTSRLASLTSHTIATQHVEWFLEIIKPLLISHMIHGFKHGREYEKEKQKG